MTQDEKFIDEIELSLLAYKIIVMDNDMELAKEVEEEITWLKSLKDKLRSLSKQDEQKHQEDDDIELTDFEADLFSAFSDGWQTYLFDKEGLNVAQWAKEHSAELLESAKQALSEWSEEDEKMLGKCIDAASGYYDPKEKDSMKLWLKSLRLQKPCGYNPYKATIESIAEMCKHYDIASHSGLRDFYGNVKVKCKEAIEYDKKHSQKQWKPSDEQMRHLASAIEESGGNSVLQELYDQLMKLKEE
jgi:hypothetical protein